MRKMGFVGLVAAVLALAPGWADASALAQSDIEVGGGAELVSGGCGPHGFRGVNGLCYRRAGRFHHRACGYGYRLTRFGCRPYY